MELDSHDFRDIQPSCRFYMFGIDTSMCTKQGRGQVLVLICWQPCVTASTRCGFSKHMTSMITSMGALNRFKFCTCVARQQHNRSPSLSLSLYGTLLGLLCCYHWKWLINFYKKSINGADLRVKTHISAVRRNIHQHGRAFEMNYPGTIVL